MPVPVAYTVPRYVKDAPDMEKNILTVMQQKQMNDNLKKQLTIYI